MPDETGWLIEKGQLCLGSCDRKLAWVTFTDTNAVRFARKIDAENMMNSLRSMGDKGAFESCTINEHMWCAPMPTDPETTMTPGEPRIEQWMNEAATKILRLALGSNGRPVKECAELIASEYAKAHPLMSSKLCEKCAPRDAAAMRALESLTPGGSEFVNDVKRCVENIRQSRDSQMQVIKQFKRRIDELEAAQSSSAISARILW